MVAAHPIIAPRFSADGNRLYSVAGTGYELFDLPSRIRLASASLPFSAQWPGAAAADGFYAATAGFFGDIWRVDDSGVAVEVVPNANMGLLPDGLYHAGGEVWARPLAFWNPDCIGKVAGNALTRYNVNFNASMVFEDSDGGAVAIGGADSGPGFMIGPAGSNGVLVATTSYGSTSGAAFGFDNGHGAYVVRQGDTLFLVDKLTLLVTAHSVVASAANIEDSFANIRAGASSFWNASYEYSSTDLSLLQTIDRFDWDISHTGADPSTELTQLLYEPVNTAMVSFTTVATQPGVILRYVDRVNNAGTTLGAIVDAMCDSAGLTDRDVSSLYAITVAGYSWTRGDVKSQMEPLLDIHDVDARPHDFSIQFLPRGSAASGTILTADLARNGDSPRYTVPIVQDTDLPVLIRVNFADTGFDQQPNNVLSPLPTDAVDSQRDVVIDLSTCAASSTEAQQLSDRYMRRQWTSKDTVQASLTEQQLALEPGDVTTLSLDGVAWNAKLEKVTVSGTRFDCTFRRDEAAVAVVNSATVGPVMDGGVVETIHIPGPIKGFIVDAPYRSDDDADIRPLLYAGAGVYAGLPYPGAVVYERTGVGDTAAYDQLFDTLGTGATWGTCNGTLPNVPSPWLWDRGNSLNIALQSGTLTSVAEADIDADPSLNLLIVGRPGAWEYVNFTTATLQGDGSWTLSGFKRGRRGTEWACAGHTAGEVVLMASSVKPEEMGSDDIGAPLSFKAQSIGRALDAATAIDVSPYTGASLKPYAPARIDWSTDGTDMTGTITRRTRTGGAWVGGSTIPLGENSEAYEVDIYHGGVLKRTITVSGSNVFVYSGTQVTDDGNTVGVAPACNVYQLSDAVGRGFALAA
jgi:hypothetical protein